MRAELSRFTTFVNRRSDSERLVLVTRAPVTEVQIEFESEGERASIVLSAEEVGRLRRMLEAMEARRRTGGREQSEIIEGEDGDALVLTRTNWGEPFDEGVSFSLRGAVDMTVDMPDSEMAFLRKALDGLLSEMEADVRVGRSPQ